MSFNGSNNGRNGGSNKSAGGDLNAGSDNGSNNGAGGNVDVIRRLNLGHRPKQGSLGSNSSLHTRASGGSSYDGDRSNSVTTGSEPASVAQWIPDVPLGDGVRTPVSNSGRTLDELNDAEIEVVFAQELAKMPPIAIVQVAKADRVPRSCEELSVVVYDLQDNLHTEFMNLRDQSATRAVVDGDTRIRVMRLEDKVKEVVDTVDKIEKTTSSIVEKLEVLLDRTGGPVATPAPLVGVNA